MEKSIGKGRWKHQKKEKHFKNKAIWARIEKRIAKAENKREL